MFSWKKQNPPSQQRQQQQQQQQQNPTGDYSDLIAQGLRLATEDMDDTAGGDEYMAEEGDDDLGDIDLDDPDLLVGRWNGGMCLCVCLWNPLPI